MVLMEEIADKEMMTVAVPGGTTEVHVPDRARTRPALTQAELDEVARLALSLEAEMGWPVDVECAFCDGQLYLLNADPSPLYVEDRTDCCIAQEACGDEEQGTMSKTAKITDMGLEERLSAVEDQQGEFPVEWTDPSEAELEWGWDDMHFPQALTTLSGDYMAGVLLEGINSVLKRRGLPVHSYSRVFNGYIYIAEKLSIPEEGMPAAHARHEGAATTVVP